MIATRLLYRNQAELTKLFRQFAQTGEPALTIKIPSDREMELAEYQALEEQIIRFQAPLDEFDAGPEKSRAPLIPWPLI